MIHQKLLITPTLMLAERAQLSTKRVSDRSRNLRYRIRNYRKSSALSSLLCNHPSARQKFGTNRDDLRGPKWPQRTCNPFLQKAYQTGPIDLVSSTEVKTRPQFQLLAVNLSWALFDKYNYSCLLALGDDY